MKGNIYFVEDEMEGEVEKYGKYGGYGDKGGLGCLGYASFNGDRRNYSADGKVHVI